MSYNRFLRVSEDSPNEEGTFLQIENAMYDLKLSDERGNAVTKLLELMPERNIRNIPDLQRAMTTASDYELSDEQWNVIKEETTEIMNSLRRSYSKEMQSLQQTFNQFNVEQKYLKNRTPWDRALDEFLKLDVKEKVLIGLLLSALMAVCVITFSWVLIKKILPSLIKMVVSHGSKLIAQIPDLIKKVSETPGFTTFCSSLCDHAVNSNNAFALGTYLTPAVAGFIITFLSQNKSLV